MAVLETTKRACRPNHFLRGVGNGVFSIVNNVAVRIHLRHEKIELVERPVGADKVPHEVDRLEKLRALFVPKMDGNDPFPLVAADAISKAGDLVKTISINAEGALHRVMSEQIKGLQKGLKKLEEEAGALRAQISKLSLDGVESQDRYSELDDLDRRLSGSWSLFQRQKAFLNEFSDLMDRMLIQLKTSNGGENATAVVHVADNLSWSEIVHYFAGGARGFILNSERLGPVNHPFIFAHNNGIPLVVIKDPLKSVDVSCRVSIDSRTGEVIIDPSEPTVNALEFRLKNYQRLARRFKDHPISTRSLDGRELPRLQMNIKDRNDFEHIRREEVGLFRTEGLYAQGRCGIQTLIRIFKEAIRRAKVVNIRLFDLAADKIPDFISAGMNGEQARLSYGIDFLLNTEVGRSILIDQIKALLIAQDRLLKGGKDELTGKKVRLIIPMVTNPEEVRQFKKLLAETQADLLARKQISEPMVRSIELGAMIETAAAVANIELLAREVSYFSIGGNDLTRDLLGFSERKKMMTGRQYDWLSPVVLANLKRVIEVAKSRGIGVGSCGELSRDPLAAIVLTLMGIDSLSMDGYYRREINYVLTSIHLGEWNKFSEQDEEGLPVIERLLRLEDALAVRQYLFDLISKRTHADTRVALEGVITSAEPLTYLINENQE